MSSLAATAADGAYPAAVVCRPSLTLNWVAEIRRFFPALTVYEVTSTKPQPVPHGTTSALTGRHGTCQAAGTAVVLAAAPGSTLIGHLITE